jgi:transcriptional regulator with XRE-family HTH domain
MIEAKFGDRLKAARKNLGLTQKQLGDLTGVGQVVIANYERGARFPGEEKLRKLAEALHVSLDYLLSVSLVSASNPSDKDLSPEKLLDILNHSTVAAAGEEIRKWKKVRKAGALEIYSRLFIPILRQTGNLWLSGQFSILDEHLVSGKIRELITLVAAEEKSWNHPPVPGKSWMGLCAPGEQHDLVLLMTSRLLQLNEWDVKFIGTQMPVKDLIQAVNSFKPKILSLSVTIDSFRAGLDTYLEVLHSNRTYDYGIILGGAAVKPEDRQKFPGVIGVAASLEEGIAIAEEYAKEKGAVK